jgi:Rrf2 family iron-sulfur cluster assembly transcriptional regulator
LRRARCHTEEWTEVQTFLPQTAEYALRAVARIAAQPAGKPLLARDLAADARIPREYLAKILRRLVTAGILESRRGRGGGFSLARGASSFRLKDVLLAVDAFPRGGRCAFGLGACDSRRPCALHSGWNRLSADFQRWASETTFADLRANPARILPGRKAK